VKCLRVYLFFLKIEIPYQAYQKGRIAKDDIVKEVLDFGKVEEKEGMEKVVDFKLKLQKDLEWQSCLAIRLRGVTQHHCKCAIHIHTKELRKNNLLK